MRRFVMSGLLGLLMLALAASARADLIFFKDGFVLQGKVKREGTTEYDKETREFTWMPKGFYFLDDGPRRIYFTPTQTAIIERLAPPNEERIVRNKAVVVPGFKPPPVEEVTEAKEWYFDEKEENPDKQIPPRRTITYRSIKIPSVSYTQQLTALTPYYLQADCVTKYSLTSVYLLREMEPETVRKLLLSNPYLGDKYMPTPPKVVGVEKKDKDKSDKDKSSKDKSSKDKAKDDKDQKEAWPDKPTSGMIVARRMRIVDFFAQAGYFTYADEELDRLLKDFPDQKKRIEAARKLVGQLRSKEEYEILKNWYHAGRMKAVRKRLDRFPLEEAPDRVVADVREMKAKIAATEGLMEQSKKALEACAKEAPKTKDGRLLAYAAGVITKELDASTVDRLDAFLGQYREAERQKERKKVPPYKPAELLALAVSGWLLGSPSAEPKVPVAISLWRTRDMVLNYCEEKDADVRKKTLEAYERAVDEKSRPDFDEVAQMIERLPPVDPGKITDDVTEVKVGKGRNKTTYHLQLPPEYVHGRSYPLLIVLHQTGEKATKMLERWEKAAAEYGYVLAAPQWEGLKQGYTYSDREHDTVLDTINDLRRRYSIDSDRVFLFGWGDGGLMAFDVGLSHPDLFAGVIPMGAGPHKYPYRYWKNGQYLPFYVISGDNSASKAAIRDQMEHWTLRGFPALWVEYKGRGNDWLGGEVTNVFDWMRHQVRAFPLRQLGIDGAGGTFGTEFCTLRAEDNRFYWLTTSDISARHIIHSDNWTNRTPPAAVTAKITTTEENGNVIDVKVQGMSQITLWMGRSPKGQMMIDPDKPVVVRAAVLSGFPQEVYRRKKLTPSLSVLLEDLATRGDRKHLFFARIDLSFRR